MKKNIVSLMCLIGTLSTVAFGNMTITEIEPTIFFPAQDDQVLRQLYRVHIDNDSDELVNVKLQFAIEGKTVSGDCGVAANSEKAVELAIPEISQPTQATITIMDPTGTVLDSHMTDIKPQKKWELYFTSVSHQDLGFIDYYQCVRRHVREGGIDKALEYCRKTDDWQHDSKFRWTVETSEPIIRWVNIRGPEKAAELTRRIKEGRISLGGLHNSISTEMAGYEVFARSFYTPNRYVVDALGIDPAKVAIIDDVPGFSWTLPLHLKEAQIPFFMHGTNCPSSLTELNNDPVFYWISPDGDPDTVLCRTDSYYSPNDIKEWTRKEIKRIVDRHIKIDWKYDCILAFDSEDFSLPHFENAENIHRWNEKWAYPKIICSTMEMFFDDIYSQIDPKDIKRFAKDAPDAWADQDITDAALLAKAREVTEKIPTAEKFSTFSMAISGGYPEKEIWQAYNRMVMYHEHTNGAIDGGRPNYYETEKVMHGTLVSEADEFADGALKRAVDTLSGAIKTKSDSLIVYNPVNWQRTDTVFIDNIEDDIILTDNVTGQKVECQKMQDGRTAFVANNVPSLGYKVFSVKKTISSTSINKLSSDAVCENKYYRITIDRDKNIISSVYDKSLNKELIDNDSPYYLGEYLYYNHTEGKFHRATFKDISLYKGDLVDEIHITQDTPDTTYLKLVVYVYKDVNRIDFDMQLDKLSNGNTLKSYHRLAKEAMYCAIPLKVPDYEFNHELSGAVVQPVVNQSKESKTSDYAIQHFADVSNSQFGVTVSTKDTPNVIYGHPRPATWDTNIDRESIMEKPKTSNMFLYLMNNMFFVNIRFDQPGEKRYRWSLRGHEGNWQKGRAYQFGWDTSNELFSVRAKKNSKGPLNGKSHSFVEIDSDHVICSTVKPAESNGRGYILRFYELSGKDTAVNVKTSFVDKLESVTAVSLIENDIEPIQITSKNSFSFEIKGSGLKTVRITAEPKAKPINKLKAKAVSDMRVDLAWSASKKNDISHYEIHRGFDPDFKPTMLTFAGHCKETKYSDMPQLNLGGWPHNILEPDTQYYYKVYAVDKSNNKSQLPDAVACKTLKSSQANQKPLQVRGLYGVHVSPNGPDNYINLWFYTNCEPDVTIYEIYRGSLPDFTPNVSNRVGSIDVENETDKYYGKVPYTKKELNRQMFADKTAQANTVYYYKVCAVDRHGLKGDFSEPCEIEMSVSELVITSDISKDTDSLSAKANIEIKWPNQQDRVYYTLDGSKPSTKSMCYSGPFLINKSTSVRAALYKNNADKPDSIVSKRYMLNRIFSQSNYGSGYSAEKAIDGLMGPADSWVSAPYGGPSKENSRDIWMTLLFSQSTDLKGLYVVGDDRGVVSTMDQFKVYLRINSEWQLVSDAKYDNDLPKNHFKIYFNKVMNADAVKLVFSKENLPFSADKGQDGIVRIYELKFILTDDRIVSYRDLE